MQLEQLERENNVRLEEPSHPGYAENRHWLASCRLSAVLDMDVQSQASGRSKACEQSDSSLDFSHGCREPDLGSAAHSRRTAQARLRSLGEEGRKRDPNLAETRRTAPSLRGSVDSRAIMLTTKLFLFYQSRGTAFVRSTFSGERLPPTPD